MKKRILSLFLVLCMAISLAPATAISFAEDDAAAAPKLILLDEEGSVGGEVVITVSTENNPGVMALSLGLDYDDTKLEFVGFENAGFTGWKVKTKAVWIGGEDNDYNGVILKLKFKILDTAPIGITEVSLTYDDGDVANSEEEIINFQVESSSVTIHNYTAVVTAPTCTEQGYTTYTCECGKSYVADYVEALGHDLVNNEAKAPTCTEIGWEAYDTCSRCDYTTYKEIPATGHSYTAVVTAPTCTDKGYTTYTCACGDSYIADYVEALGHDYGDWTVTLAPTCTASGSKIRCCNECDAYEVKAISALGHGYVHHDAKAPTCTEIGWEEYDTCSRCDYTTYKEIPATGHSYTTKVTAPTCTDKGYTTYTCACGDSYVADYTNALGHDYGSAVFTWDGFSCKATFTCKNCKDVQTLDCTVTSEVTKAASCTETGVRTYTASVEFEGKTYTADKAEILEKLKHTAGDAVRENEIGASCTEPGSYDEVVYCTECKAELSRTNKTVDVLGHNYGAWTVTTAATCTTSGVETHYCIRCDAYETREVKALGHDLVHHDGKAATCTEAGWEAYDTCTRCDYTTYKEIPATGHHYTAAVTAPNCTEKGYTTYTCACGDSYIADYVEALGHGYVHHDAKAPTCTEIGWEAYDTCSRCDYTTYKEIPATGHSYTTKVTAPTCTDKGYTTYTCACGYSYIDNYVEALGHDYGSAVFTWDGFSCKATFTCKNCKDVQTLNCTVTSEVTKAANCTETGVKTYTARVVFDGKTYTENKTETISALGHDYVHHNAKAPTCTEIGWEAYDTCTRCDYTTYKEIPATGHSYTTKVTAPTCTDKGYTTYTCACGDSYVADYTNALGHKYGEWKVTTAATCTEKGVEKRSCSRCGAYETRDVEALGHDYVNGKCTVCNAADPSWVNPFVDVKEGTVYYDAILWAYNHTPERITEGSDATHFNPNGNCTRGQVVTFLWRAEGCPEPTGNCPFVDVSSTSPYYKAIIWAAEQGITNGFDATHFVPNATVTRAQFVTFLWRYEGKPTASAAINFADASTIAAPFKDAVAWAVSTGVTNGYEDGTFRPNATCTRWAVVLFMYRDLT